MEVSSAARKTREQLFDYYANLERNLQQVRDEISKLKKEAFDDLAYISGALVNEEESRDDNANVENGLLELEDLDFPTQLEGKEEEDDDDEDEEETQYLSQPASSAANTAASTPLSGTGPVPNNNNNELSQIYVTPAESWQTLLNVNPDHEKTIQNISMNDGNQTDLDANEENEEDEETSTTLTQRTNPKVDDTSDQTNAIHSLQITTLVRNLLSRPNVPAPAVPSRASNTPSPNSVKALSTPPRSRSSEQTRHKAASRSPCVLEKKSLDKFLKMASYNSSLLDLNQKQNEPVKSCEVGSSNLIRLCGRDSPARAPAPRLTESRRPPINRSQLKSEREIEAAIASASGLRASSRSSNPFRVPSSRHFCGRLLSTSQAQPESSSTNSPSSSSPSSSSNCASEEDEVDIESQMSSTSSPSDASCSPPHSVSPSPSQNKPVPLQRRSISSSSSSNPINQEQETQRVRFEHHTQNRHSQPPKVALNYNNNKLSMSTENFAENNENRQVKKSVTTQNVTTSGHLNMQSQLAKSVDHLNDSRRQAAIRQIDLQSQKDLACIADSKTGLSKSIKDLRLFVSNSYSPSQIVRPPPPSLSAAHLYQEIQQETYKTPPQQPRPRNSRDQRSDQIRQEFLQQQQTLSLANTNPKPIAQKLRPPIHPNKPPELPKPSEVQKPDDSRISRQAVKSAEGPPIYSHRPITIQATANQRNDDALLNCILEMKPLPMRAPANPINSSNRRTTAFTGNSTPITASSAATSSAPFEATHANIKSRVQVSFKIFLFFEELSIREK